MDSWGSGYTHKKLRSACHSLKRHLPWLFAFEDFPALDIPNTTNLPEGKFVHYAAFSLLL